MDLAPVLEALKAVQETQKQASETQKQTADTLKAIADQAEKAKSESPWGVPNIRKGENTLTSRGYSYMKAWGLMAGLDGFTGDTCSVEKGLSEKLRVHYNKNGFKKQLDRSVMVPFFGDGITDDVELAAEVKGLTCQGAGAIDPDEVKHIRKQMSRLGMTKALSWIDETVGGALVAPPQFGELIELLRVNEVFMAAGARVFPMPPQGRITLPSQKSAMTAYHVGESQTLTDSTPGTGDLVLQAKKLSVLAKIPNELFHFSAIPIEAFVREDMTKVISIAMDKALWEGNASDVTPKGLINYPILTYTSVDPGNVTNGYRLQPGDPYGMVATVQEKNAQFKAFVMRPLLWSTFVTRRADSVTAGDGKGPFIFNLIRAVSDDMNLERLKVGNLLGYPVYKTTQLSVGRSLGSSTNLTYAIGGDFTDYYIAMGGALEFQVSTQGDTPFTQDQTWFKGIMYYDGAPRHDNSFVICDTLYQST